MSRLLLKMRDFCKFCFVVLYENSCDHPETRSTPGIFIISHKVSFNYKTHVFNGP